jgi:hypothetical protein
VRARTRLKPEGAADREVVGSGGQEVRFDARHFVVDRPDAEVEDVPAEAPTVAYDDVVDYCPPRRRFVRARPWVRRFAVPDRGEHLDEARRLENVAHAPVNASSLTSPQTSVAPGTAGSCFINERASRSRFDSKSLSSEEADNPLPPKLRVQERRVHPGRIPVGRRPDGGENIERHDGDLRLPRRRRRAPGSCERECERSGRDRSGA